MIGTMKYILPVGLLLAFALISCGQTSPSIDFGKAECAHCRMNVVDRQYGAVLVTQKGRQYVFDDVSCMIRFVDAGTVARSQVAQWYVCDHSHPGQLLDATKASYLNGPSFRSPMRGDVAAFPDEEARSRASHDDDASLDWSGVEQLFAE